MNYTRIENLRYLPTFSVVIIGAQFLIFHKMFRIRDGHEEERETSLKTF